MNPARCFCTGYSEEPLQKPRTGFVLCTRPSCRCVAMRPTLLDMWGFYPILGGLCMISSPAPNLIPTDLHRL